MEIAKYQIRSNLHNLEQKKDSHQNKIQNLHPQSQLHFLQLTRTQSWGWLCCRKNPTVSAFKLAKATESISFVISFVPCPCTMMNPKLKANENLPVVPHFWTLLPIPSISEDFVFAHFVHLRLVELLLLSVTFSTSHLRLQFSGVILKAGMKEGMLQCLCSRNSILRVPL